MTWPKMYSSISVEIFPSSEVESTKQRQPVFSFLSRKYFCGLGMTLFIKSPYKQSMDISSTNCNVIPWQNSVTEAGCDVCWATPPGRKHTFSLKYTHYLTMQIKLHCLAQWVQS
jgi:hypothetical protein